MTSSYQEQLRAVSSSDKILEKVHKVPHLRYRADIDGLRAIAVSLVVGYHAWPKFFPGGYIGVDIFFVISGFLITGIIFDEIQKSNFSILAFYKRRIRRIFPALFVVTLAVFIFGWFYLPVKEFKSLGLSLIGSAAFVQNFVLLGEVGYFDVEAIKKPLLHIWSLGIEEQYYIVWPVILCLIVRLRMNVATVIFIMALASFWFGAHLLKNSFNQAFYLPVARFWELLAGSGLAIGMLLVHEDPRIKHLQSIAENFLHRILFMKGTPRQPDLGSHVGAMLALTLVIWGAFHFNQKTTWPGYHALVPVMGAMGLIFFHRSWINQSLLSSKLMVFIGLISYPLYLWHFPIMAYAHNLRPDGFSKWLMAELVLVSVLLSWLTQRWIEQPIRFGWLRQRAVLPLLCGMAVISMFGIYVYQTDGAIIRIPAELKVFMLTGEETSQHWRHGACLLGPNQSAASFAPDCSGEGGRPLLLLWGDSYAAAQYAGLNTFKKEFGYDVAEYTSSACPPLLGYVHPEREFCKNNNDFIMKRIEALKPEVVILHSTWMYGRDVYNKGFAETIPKLRALGVKKIVLLGPVPAWREPGLSANVVGYYFSHRRQLIPPVTQFRLIENDLEKQMREYAEKFGIDYISVKNVMCNDKGCLARIGPHQESLTAFDTGHMTLQGSTYLMRSILPELLRGVK